MLKVYFTSNISFHRLPQTFLSVGLLAVQDEDLYGIYVDSCLWWKTQRLIAGLDAEALKRLSLKLIRTQWAESAVQFQTMKSWNRAIHTALLIWSIEGCALLGTAMVNDMLIMLMLITHVNVRNVNGLLFASILLLVFANREIRESVKPWVGSCLSVPIHKIFRWMPSTYRGPNEHWFCNQKTSQNEWAFQSCNLQQLATIFYV